MRETRGVTPLWASTAGALAALTSIAAAVTMTGRLLRVRTAAGFAVGTWLLLTLSTVVWFAYGISVRSAPQIIANGTWMIPACVLTWLMLRRHGARLASLGLMAVIGTLLIFILIGLISPAAPGWVGLPTSLLLNLPQIRYTLRHGRGPGVSVLGWAMMGTSSTLWCIYGIGTGEAPVIVNSGVQSLMLFTVVVALLIRPEFLASDEQHDAVA